MKNLKEKILELSPVFPKTTGFKKVESLLSKEFSKSKIRFTIWELAYHGKIIVSDLKFCRPPHDDLLKFYEPTVSLSIVKENNKLKEAWQLIKLGGLAVIKKEDDNIYFSRTNYGICSPTDNERIRIKYFEELNIESEEEILNFITRSVSCDDLIKDRLDNSIEYIENYLIKMVVLNPTLSNSILNIIKSLKTVKHEL